MKRLTWIWETGVSYLFTEDIISFYTYFAIIFTEIAFLWVKFTPATAIPFTIILIGFIFNLLIFSGLKGYFEGYFKGTKKELFCSNLLFFIVSLLLCVIGCFFNILLSIALTFIPVIATLIWEQLVEAEIFYSISSESVESFLQVSIILIPFFIFTYFILLIPTISIIIKIVILFVYLICVPFISFLEGEVTVFNLSEFILYMICTIIKKKKF